jgi:hypothetical protein
MQPQTRRDIVLAFWVGLVALAPRLFGLNVFLTADEPKSWFGRSIQFLEALARGNWAATFDSPAPGVTTMWAGAVGLLLDYARQGFPGALTGYLATVPFDPLDLAILPLIRLPIVIAATLTAVLTYWWGRVVFGQLAALLAALFIALDPFLLALTRILGHDGPVTLFIWLSLLAFLRSRGQGTGVRKQGASEKFSILNSQFSILNSHLLLSGAFGGLAFLSKYPSLFVGAFLAVTMLILHLRSRQSWSQALRRWLIEVSLWSLAAALVFVSLWPAMWVDPVGHILAIINDALRASGSPHQKGSFFFGQPVSDPGSSFYLIVTLFKTTPVLWFGWLLLLLSPVLALLKKIRHLAMNNENPPIFHPSTLPPFHPSSLPAFHPSILILFTFILTFALLVTIGGKKQDRYILPIFPALATLAAIGYAQGFQQLQASIRRPNQEVGSREQRVGNNEQLAIHNSQFTIHNSQFLLTALLALTQAAFTLPHFPYYFTYYNPWLGGGQAAAKTIIVGWGEGLDEAARWLNTRPTAAKLQAVAWYSTTFEPYFDGHAIYKIEEDKISRTPKPGLAGDYVILYANQLQRQLPTEGALQYFRAVEPAHIVTLHGLDYAWIYPSIRLQHIINGDARLVGQAELLGFNLFDPNGHRLAATPADRPAQLQLYWEWQGKSPAEPIGLSLIDENGHQWGWGHPLGTQARLPFAQWQDGFVAHDDFTLEIYPGAPPGDYYLKVWIDRPATGELVGAFPLALADGRLAVAPPLTPPSLLDLPLGTVLDAPLLDRRVTLAGLTNFESSRPWQPEQSRDLVLYWQANQPIDQNLQVFLTLTDTSGRSRAGWSGLPAAARYPTARWQAGDLIRDPWQLTLPPHVPPGDYRLTARLGDSAPVDLVDVTVAGRPRQFETPPLVLTLNTRFGDGIELLGLAEAPLSGSSLVVRPGQPLTLELVWQANDLIEANYTLTAQLLDAEQHVRAQQDRLPLDGAAPTSSWTTGEILIDSIRLDLPPDLGPGPHSLLIALYQAETGERLPLPNGADHLTIPMKTMNNEQ